jgi:hypothetical protein
MGKGIKEAVDLKIDSKSEDQNLSADIDEAKKENKNSESPLSDG